MGKKMTLGEQLLALQVKFEDVSEELVRERMTVETMKRQEQLLRSEFQAEVNKLRMEHAEALKKVENTSSYYQREQANIASELEQAHAVLDGVEGAPTREYEMEYGNGRRNVVTRLAGAFLAIARSGGVK